MTDLTTVVTEAGTLQTSEWIEVLTRLAPAIGMPIGDREGQRTTATAETLEEAETTQLGETEISLVEMTEQAETVLDVREMTPETTIHVDKGEPVDGGRLLAGDHLPGGEEIHRTEEIGSLNAETVPRHEEGGALLETDVEDKQTGPDNQLSTVEVTIILAGLILLFPGTVVSHLGWEGLNPGTTRIVHNHQALGEGLTTTEGETHALEGKALDDERVAETAAVPEGHEAETVEAGQMTTRTTPPCTQQISSELISQKDGLSLHVLN